MKLCVSAAAAVYTCIILTVATWFYVLIFVPECAPRRRKACWQSYNKCTQGSYQPPSRDAAGSQDLPATSQEREKLWSHKEPAGEHVHAVPCADSAPMSSCLHGASSSSSSLPEPVAVAGPGGAGAGGGGGCHEDGEAVSGCTIILTSPWYRKLVVIWVIVGMTWEGAQVRWWWWAGGEGGNR